MPGAAGPLAAEAVPLEAFLKLIRFPILICYGDNIPTEAPNQFAILPVGQGQGWSAAPGSAAKPDLGSKSALKPVAQAGIEKPHR